MIWWNVYLYIYSYVFILHFPSWPRHWFPGLLRCEGFLREFVTPIVKVSKGTEVVSFFTLPVACWKQNFWCSCVGWGAFIDMYMICVWIQLFIMYVYVYIYRFGLFDIFTLFWIYIYMIPYPGLIIAYQYPLPSWVCCAFSCRRNYNITWKESMASHSHVLVCHGSLLSHLFGIVPSTFTTAMADQVRWLKKLLFTMYPGPWN